MLLFLFSLFDISQLYLISFGYRELLDLKKYVRNRAHREASIGNGYLMAECMNFCTSYLNEVETLDDK